MKHWIKFASDSIVFILFHSFLFQLYAACGLEYQRALQTCYDQGLPSSWNPIVNIRRIGREPEALVSLYLKKTMFHWTIIKLGKLDNSVFGCVQFHHHKSLFQTILVFISWSRSLSGLARHFKTPTRSGHAPLSLQSWKDFNLSVIRKCYSRKLSRVESN